MTKIQRYPLCLIEKFDSLDEFIVTPIENSRPLHNLACFFSDEKQTKDFVEYYTQNPYGALSTYRLNERLEYDFSDF